MIEPTLALAAVAAVLALGPAALFLVNLLVYRPPRATSIVGSRSVSVLIPARDEETVIGAAVSAALANEPSLAAADVELEILVLDDGSTDRTPEIVRALAKHGPVRLLQGTPLPDGWCGKMHACQSLAEAARGEHLVFIDADARLAPDGVVRLLAAAERDRLDLVSGVPRQETFTWAEKLVVPLIHFVLLGFLPMPLARLSDSPAFGAGCGQLFLARRSAWSSMGGHGAIRATLHDGVALPRAFRAAGLRTGLVDATDVATCRMYEDARSVWEGFAKNATEGLASAAMIVPATALLLGGQVLPFVLLALAGLGVLSLGPLALALTGAAAVGALLPRAVAAERFRQSWLGVLLHPVGVAMLVGIQWHARLRALRGVAPTWKGRSYPSSDGPVEAPASRAA